MADKALPSIETLRNLIDYDPETGRMVWKSRPREMFKSDKNWKWWNTRYAGTEAASSLATYGHRQLKINDRSYAGHRVAWAIHHGEWPNIIDHINGKPADNRICNLRNVTMMENQRNQRMHVTNTSGVCGVSWSKLRCKWIAQIRLYDRSIYLGAYDSMDEAVIARSAANKVLGYTKRHGT